MPSTDADALAAGAPSSLPTPEPPATPDCPAVYAVGEYRVGDAEDELLNGHPDIRY
ncbi:hypothetical protein [Hymenobacter persicinus]|uniref:hypothetical protein n=1 Tax=Hymenobacter persicinus TaxID=2025506 RepID=UPI0013E9F434|nr:hypothetical protein [Hymenobacter persicinus]